MKSLNILFIVALQLLIFEISEGSLIARGRSRSRKPEKHMRIKRFRCLEDPSPLPECNWGFIGSDEENDDMEMSRKPRSAVLPGEPEDISTFNANGEYPRGILEIYRLHGCRTEILPFDYPLCTPEYSIGRKIEIHGVLPWIGPPGPVPYVFPEIDMDEWRRCMQGPCLRKNNIKAKKTEKNTKEIVPEEPPEELDSKKSAKPKKTFDQVVTSKKSIGEKLAAQLSRKKLDENDIHSKFPSSVTMKKRLTIDLQDDPNFSKPRSSRLNRIVDEVSNQDSKGKIVSNNVEKMMKSLPFLQHRQELVFDEMLPKPLNTGYSYEKHSFTKREAKFSPSESDVKKQLRIYKAMLFYVLEEAKSPFDDENPYLIDPRKPMSEEQAREQLDEVKSALLMIIRNVFAHLHAQNTIPTTSDKSKDVPFDSKMLKAAKAGETFPYEKKVPDDTSKNVAKVPVKNGKTTWDELPFSLKRFSVRKQDNRMRNIRNQRELAKNDIDDWNEVEKNSDSGIIDFHKRVTRNNGKFEDSEDFSKYPPYEFPYEKAIPYDPVKHAFLKRNISEGQDEKAMKK